MRLGMTFACGADSKAEEEAVGELAAELGELVESRQKFVTLLRFVRGYAKERSPIIAAAAAYGAMLEWRQEHAMDAVRAELLPAGPNTSSSLWPMALPRFAPLVDCIGSGLSQHWSPQLCNPVVSTLRPPTTESTPG